ncbi:hypothetical protein EDD15DRAFT_2191472 [Pisolithus albus]|nr:hypothetical protein EDD15DRAFT_2191472 [Pisolithus albus]
MDSTEADIGKLPIKEILRKLSGIMSVSKQESKKKDKLLKRIIADGSPELIDALRRAGVDHQQQKVSSRRVRKRRIEEDLETLTARKIPRLQEGTSGDIATTPTTFLQVPSTDELPATMHLHWARVASVPESVTFKKMVCGV